MVSVWIAVAAFFFGGVVGFGLMSIIAIGRVSDDDFGRDLVDHVPESLPEAKPANPHQLTFISSNGHRKAKLLNARQAARRVGMSPRWLYDHKLDLPFTVRTGKRSYRFDSARLDEWVAAKKAK